MGAPPSLPRDSPARVRRQLRAGRRRDPRRGGPRALQESGGSLGASEQGREELAVPGPGRRVPATSCRPPGFAYAPRGGEVSGRAQAHAPGCRVAAPPSRAPPGAPKCSVRLGRCGRSPPKTDAHTALPGTLRLLAGLLHLCSPGGGVRFNCTPFCSRLLLGHTRRLSGRLPALRSWQAPGNMMGCRGSNSSLSWGSRVKGSRPAGPTLRPFNSPRG